MTDMLAAGLRAAVLAAGILLACAADPGLEERSFTGMSLEQVRAALGEPDRVEEIRKTASHVFGPIEGLWDRAEMGDAIVTWIYEARNGRKELYFLDGEAEISAEFFWYHDQSKNPVF